MAVAVADAALDRGLALVKTGGRRCSSDLIALGNERIGAIGAMVSTGFCIEPATFDRPDFERRALRIQAIITRPKVGVDGASH
jgi:hypothetical protein